MDIAPQRLSWLPGDAIDRATGLVYQEAQSPDHALIRGLCRGTPAGAVLKRAFRDSDWVVRVGRRNSRFVCALSVSRHRLDGNDIKLAWVDPALRTTDIVLDELLTLARLELPEAPAVLWVDDHDTWTQCAAARLGLKGYPSAHDPGYFRFDGPALVAGAGRGLPPQ